MSDDAPDPEISSLPAGAESKRGAGARPSVFERVKRAVMGTEQQGGDFSSASLVRRAEMSNLETLDYLDYDNYVDQQSEASLQLDPAGMAWHQHKLTFLKVLVWRSVLERCARLVSSRRSSLSQLGMTLLIAFSTAMIGYGMSSFLDVLVGWKTGV